MYNLLDYILLDCGDPFDQCYVPFSGGGQSDVSYAVQQLTEEVDREILREMFGSYE